jgi:hypothetical protein
MNQGRHSSWFSRSVLEQPGCHPALREPASQAGLRLPWERGQNDPLAFECKVDGRSGMQPEPVSKILRNHDLTLGADSISHTDQV